MKLNSRGCGICGLSIVTIVVRETLQKLFIIAHKQRYLLRELSILPLFFCYVEQRHKCKRREDFAERGYDYLVSNG